MRVNYTLDFVKMHGAGNDYVYIDCTGSQAHLADSTALPFLARAISDRHFGIGGDGLVVITRCEKADFRMRMFNADGSEAQMCGNASRCVGKYVSDSGLTDRDCITLLTGAGIKVLYLHKNAKGIVESVTVDMGAPLLAVADVPAVSPISPMINVPINIGEDTFRVTAVSMGNPHGVIFTDELSDELVLGRGPELERHPTWPEKANIEFVKVLSRTHIRMRVWERGTGETLACGTGSCAAVVATALNGLTGRSVDVDLPGGRLKIEWDEATAHVFMTGPATIVAKGTYHIPAEIASHFNTL